MRTLLLSLLCLFGALNILQAQDYGIAYQAVARDADGDPLADAELNVRVTLMSADGSALWQESHASVLTNQFGNLALTIGDGALAFGSSSLSDVDWSESGLHFSIEVDAGAGYASFGDVDVQAVPVAMYALNGQEEEIAALQLQLNNLEGDVSTFVGDLQAAIDANAAADADESAAGAAADADLQAAIDANAAANAAADAAAADASAAADADLQAAIDANAAADAAAAAASDAADAAAADVSNAADAAAAAASDAADADLQAAIDANAAADAASDAAASAAADAAAAVSAAADAAAAAASDAADADLQAAIDANAQLSAAEDAYLLGLIESNDGEISILQSNVSQNTTDLGDLLSVISLDVDEDGNFSGGVTVTNMTVTGELNLTGVFSAATALFNYMSANNADFEDMIAEAAQVEELVFYSGRGLGDGSELDIDGTLNVDGNSTMGGNLDVDGTITTGGQEVATAAYSDAGDASNAQAIADNASADADQASADAIALAA
ncbi:MAG: hypothetical protein OSA37_03535, partial [Flavobacteriales bacterium]|nr:hypothetical protein [Flavobacteriales bacterium]